ncbi:MAG TPA: 3-hydroxybutyryl-CoA dehydrogenase [Phenylobacterium sp.]|uniref:3-hydroxybutyryl-CoA dehydrogenase n=1 Tax=Phenylobacterium sp. TaxID=1871053 RepID=UPI002B465D7A|nr:3-hydroxybutyryl-CoA dehydrogenase [Phenylobacterium sp.]HKR88809.1 3-hydroxybutyryl-CoA dehydrogenase [Phenylobacterium sp.]
MATEAPRIGAVGAGRMGRGIATAFAIAGRPVTLIDLRPRDTASAAALEAAALGAVVQDIAFLVRLGLMDDAAAKRAAGRVAFAPLAKAGDAIAACEVLFEGVAETVEAKAGCFAVIAEHAQADAIIASTTSTIDAETLAPLVPGRERFLNAHWLNPAHLMPLVEVSPAASTSASVVDAMRELLVSIGKVPVVCKSSPGYIVPRIQALAMNEAARMVEEGVGSAEDIDTAVRVGFGLRFAVLGLLEFIDWGGGDILHHASTFLSKSLDPARFAAPAIIDRNMKEARRGLQDGVGFYAYDGVDLDAYRAARMSDFVGMLRQRDLLPRIESAGGGEAPASSTAAPRN